ncbi:MAG: TonB-dependent receptor [Bryobacterales bacterium]|nr:TonB-dependent receptor [Bryobacterales bacterium]
MKLTTRLLLLGLSGIILPFSLFGQLDRGAISGIVTDPSAAGVAGAKVTATHLDTNVATSTSTSATGNYTLPMVPVGRYRFEVEAAGFRRSVRPDVTVAAGSTLRLDVALELGMVTESVEVVTEAPNLEVDTARVATNVTGRLVSDLPLVVSGRIRSVFDLAVLAPETSTGNNFRIGGGQGASYDMLMDGTSTSAASNNYQAERAPLANVSVDAIGEFSVEYRGMKAEYGRAMGVINFVTKSGTNEFHGSAYDFIRNDALDARGFFAVSTPVLKQHNFGATLGGPVRLPKIYDGRNKTFMFLSYEGFRNRAGSSPTYSTIPLPEMYEGNFNGWVTGAGKSIPIYDPGTTRLAADGKTYIRDPFPSNLIPTNRFSQVAKNYISIKPADLVPNVPGAGPRQNFFRDKGGQTEPWNKASAKLDHNFTESDRFSYLFTHGRWETIDMPDGPPGLPLPFNGLHNWTRKNTSHRFNYTRVFSPTVLNSLRVSYNRDLGDLMTSTAVDPNAKWGERVGIKNSDPTLDRGLPAILMTEYTQWSTWGFGFDRGRDLHIADDLTLIRGAHTFKGGFFFQGDRWDGGGQHRNNGSFGFTQLATAIPGDQSRNTGNAFASFLLGYVNDTALETKRNVIQKWRYMGGYLQDDWRVTSRLTLNLGLRYEYTFPVTGGAEIVFGNEPPGFSNFDAAASNPGAGGRPGAVVFTGKGAGRTGREAPFDGWKKAFSPRLGMAYQARKGTVLRLNAGRSFAAVKVTGGSAHYDGFIGNFSWASADLNILDFPTMLDQGLPAWKQPPNLVPDVSNNQARVDYWLNEAGRPSEYWTWGFDIQQELPANSVLTLGYSGNAGVHLTSGLLGHNQIDPRYLTQYGPAVLRSRLTSAAGQATGIPMPYPGFNGTVQQALQPFPQFKEIDSTNGGEKNGHSSYHAMVMKFDKRYSSGLTLLGSYVLSKLFTDAEYAGLSRNYALDTFNRGLEKALSGSDQTHVTRMSFSYDLPFGRGVLGGPGGLAGRLLGDWTLAGFLQYASGMPMGVAPGVNPPIYPGTGSNRVTIASYDNWRAPVSGEKFDPFKDLWWNKSAFQQQPASVLDSTLGNATQRNPKERSPWILDENVSVAKSIKATERVRFVIRGEAFNLFNRVRWGGPSGTWTAGNFGQVRSQGNSPRRLQFGLKVEF